MAVFRLVLDEDEVDFGKQLLAKLPCSRMHVAAGLVVEEAVAAVAEDRERRDAPHNDVDVLEGLAFAGSLREVTTHERQNGCGRDHKVQGDEVHPCSAHDYTAY